MANLNESASFNSTVPAIDITDQVVGADTAVDPNTGVANLPHVALANRTSYLKSVQDSILSTLSTKLDTTGGTLTGDLSVSAGKKILVNTIQAISGGIVDFGSSFLSASIAKISLIIPKSGSSVNVNGLIIDQTNQFASFPYGINFANSRNIIDGLVNEYVAAQSFRVNPGVCSDDVNSTIISHTAAITKDPTAIWTAGDGNGALVEGSGVLPGLGRKWFYVFVVRNVAGNTDVCLDSDPSGANVFAASSPIVSAGYNNAMRRIGAISLYWNGSSVEIDPFDQLGDRFQFRDNKRFTSSGGVSIGTSATNVPVLEAPFPICAFADLHITLRCTDTADITDIIHLLQYDFTGSMSYETTIEGTTGSGVSRVNIDRLIKLDPSTGNMQAIRPATIATVNLRGYVVGWIDLRGKDAI